MNIPEFLKAVDYAKRVAREMQREEAKMEKAARSTGPSYGEPEGVRPGTRPSVAEPDDLTSPSGFPQATQIETTPAGHRSTGSARSVPGDVDDPIWMSTLQAAALNMGRLVPRPVSDLRDMLAVEVEAIRERRSIDRTGALAEAMGTLVNQIKAGLR